MKYPYWHPIPAGTPVEDVTGMAILAMSGADDDAAVCRFEIWSPTEDGERMAQLTYARLDRPQSVHRLTGSLEGRLDFRLRSVVSDPVIAVAIPDWQARRHLPLGAFHWASLTVITLVVALVVFIIGGPVAGFFAVPAGLLAALAMYPMIRPRGEFAIRTTGDLQLDEHNLLDYARARLDGERPEMQRLEDRRAAIVARVDDLRAEHIALREDIVFRIDFPAMFDTSVPTTAEFQTSLVRFDDVAAAGDVDDLEQAAAEVEITYATARQHAETVGIRHLPEDKRDDARRASKAARLAARASTEGERVASLTQTKRILDSLGLHYMPEIGEPLAIER